MTKPYRSEKEQSIRRIDSLPQKRNVSFTKCMIPAWGPASPWVGCGCEYQACSPYCCCCCDAAVVMLPLWCCCCDAAAAVPKGLLSLLLMLTTGWQGLLLVWCFSEKCKFFSWHTEIAWRFRLCFEKINMLKGPVRFLCLLMTAERFLWWLNVTGGWVAKLVARLLAMAAL